MKNLFIAVCIALLASEAQALPRIERTLIKIIPNIGEAKVSPPDINLGVAADPEPEPEPEPLELGVSSRMTAPPMEVPKQTVRREESLGNQLRPIFYLSAYYVFVMLICMGLGDSYRNRSRYL